MKKKIGLLFGVLLGIALVSGAYSSHSYAPIYAEGEEPETSEPAPETSEEPTLEEENEFECKVVLGAYDHGEVSVDILEGHVGDIVTLNAKHDLFYLVDYVRVNDINLIEDEDISGRYQFALVEGDNIVAAKFVVDSELLGELSVIYDQAANKDWTNLFSVENVVRIVSFLLSGGLLVAMVRYFIKDKRIAKNVETSVQDTVKKLLPDMTKKVVEENIKETISPIFAQTSAYQQDILRVLGILVKCIALMQENTPDSRRAILAELANLNIGDMKVIEEAKKIIDEYLINRLNQINNIVGSLDEIVAKNQEVIGAEEETGEEINEELPPADDGTQI